MRMILNRHGKKAYRDLAIAMSEKGANCMDNPGPWDGHVDDQGRQWLPTEEEVKKLCEGCPLLGAECREALHKGAYTFVAMNGEVVDKWGLSGVDLFAPERSEEEGVENA